jgi:hypothetical protein
MSMAKGAVAQSVCETLLDLYHRVMSSSYLDTGGSMIGEAVRDIEL